MYDYYLAIDIGASSGRHILGHIENNKIILEEVHRFENGVFEKDGQLCWDYEKLFSEIKTGLRKCKEINKIPKSIGIDTWGVDFVLLDEKNEIIGNTVAYRDDRTVGMDKKVYEVIDESDLYQRTGIQKQLFNTIYQLMAIKEKNSELLDTASTMLLVPDYFNFLLTGEKKTEYTNATTTQLVDPYKNIWDYELIEKLGYPKEIFKDIITPKTLIGKFTKEIEDEVGYNCNVIAPATHDTGSAVVAIPYTDTKSLYISSGTWSLMGIEDSMVNCTYDSYKDNFTNEGGYDYRFRYLKNIMGLWLIQNVRKELDNKYSFAELCDIASKEEIESIINCNDERLTAPKNMINMIKLLCKENGADIPETEGEIAKVVYQSLAYCYNDVLKEIEETTGRNFEKIYIIGGGAKAGYLNAITAKVTERIVKSVPVEATALGNVLVQMIADGIFRDIFEARECVRNSFDIETYYPDTKKECL